MDACSYAWAAGLFEGEGSLVWVGKGAHGRHRRYPAAYLGMTDEDVVRRFAEVVGVGRVTMPKSRPNRKQMWQWRAFGLDAMRTLDAVIGPYLCVRRRAKLDELLTFVPLRQSERGQWIGQRRFSPEGMEALRAAGRRTARLTVEDVREIKRRLEDGQSQRSIAHDLGIGRTTVWNIASGTSWSHVVPA